MMVEDAIIGQRKKHVRLENLKPSYPRAFYWLILINVVIDILAFWSEPGGLTAIVRVVILYAAFFYFLLIKKIKFEKNIYIVIFSVYVLLQLFIAVDLDYSLKISIQIITSLMMFFVGYALIKNEFDFYYYLKQFFWIYVVIIINTFVSNIFDKGVDDYTKLNDYVVGGLNDLWNTYSYSLFLLPLLLKYHIKRKWVLYISGFLILIFLILSLKRISIIGVVFGSLIFIYFMGLDRKILKKISFFIFVILITSPFYSDLLINRIKVRADQGRFESDFYESEGRYLELIFLKEKIIAFNDPLEIFFGLRALDSRGVVGTDNRQFHIDYSLIAFTLGFVGLIFYLMIYFHLVKHFLKLYRDLKSNKYFFSRFKIHVVTGIVLIFSSLITSMGGQMYHITFRLIVFMTIGAIFRLLYSSIYKFSRSRNAYFDSLQSKF